MAKKNGFSESELDALVSRARSQGEALAQLYECLVDSVFRFCKVRLTDQAAAEDVCSEIFLEVARGIHSFRGSTYTDFRNWVFAIAANHANSYLRKTLRRARLQRERQDDLVPQPSGAEADWEALDWPTLQLAIQDLKPDHQTILTLRFFENLDYASIGVIMKQRPGAVRVTLHRILKKLRHHLWASEEEGQDDG